MDAEQLKAGTCALASSYYAVLGLHDSASDAEIRSAYRRAVLECHPDKAVNHNHEDNMTHDRFIEVQKAWEHLSDPVKRAAHDELLTGKVVKVTSAEEVDLAEWLENEEQQIFSYDCRCGGTFLITYEDLECGDDVVQCDNCSLSIRAIYQVQ